MEPHLKKILLREDDPTRPSVENRVAYQGEREVSIMASAMDRERLDNIFRIVINEVERLKAGGKTEIRILDIGCAYGNMALMLNARLGKDRGVRIVSVSPSRQPA